MSSSILSLLANERTSVGKESTSAIRKQGLVPAIVYGAAGQSDAHVATSVSVVAKELVQVLKNPLGRNVTIELTTQRTNGVADVCKVIPYRIDRDPITLKVLHVDFFRVTDTTPVEVTVELKLTGTAPGVKLGGMLVQKRNVVVIRSLPQNIPAFVSVDLSNLNVNQSIRIKDIASDQFETVSPGELIIVEVVSKGKAEESKQG